MLTLSIYPESIYQFDIIEKVYLHLKFKANSLLGNAKTLTKCYCATTYASMNDALKKKIPFLGKELNC